MKTFLILTASYGEGHNTAARNIRAGIEAVAGDRARAKVVDPMETYGAMNDWCKKAYLLMINRAPKLWAGIYRLIDRSDAVKEGFARLAPLHRELAALIAAEKPDAIIATYPFYNLFLRQLYPEGTPRPFAQVTVVTDSITINSIWHYAGSDAYLVPNADTAAVLRQQGVPPEKTHTLGFPVSLRFADRGPLQTPPGPGERWKVLYVINSGKSDAPALVEALLKIDTIDLTITAGRDASLKKTLETIVARSGRTAEVLGWTDRLPELMCRSHLVISKAGGATVQETLAARVPLLITQIVPGQEEGNAQLLLQHQCGVLAPSVQAIPQIVADTFADGGARWQEQVTRMDRIRFPDASREIARFLLSLNPPAAS